MERPIFYRVFILFALQTLIGITLLAEERPRSGVDKSADKRGVVSPFMERSYFEIAIGAIGYPFGERQLQPGFVLEGVKINRPAVRLVLLGHQFNRYLAAQITYMRPIWWVDYRYSVEGEIPKTTYKRTVWMNIAGATLRGNLPISEKLSLYGEGGLGVVTRNGITDEQGREVVSDLNFATTTIGAGVSYKLSNSWALQGVASYTAATKRNDQPYSSFVGTGFKYQFQPFSERALARAEQRGLLYPKQWLHASYTTSLFGYGVNNFLRSIYLFWGGAVEVERGGMVSYQRNIFHGPKVFSLDVGANGAIWQSRGGENFYALSLYPVIRLSFLRNEAIDPYFFYILGGPTYLSKHFIDGVETGRHFTFYDAFGFGGFFGKGREYNCELKIAHYSNGNLFPTNRGIKIPITLSLGYAF